MALIFDTREAFLTEAAALCLDDVIMPVVEASKFEFERPRFRISVGFPPNNRGGKTIAVCFVREASGDGVNEIFVNPTIDDPLHVLEAVAHELIHAVDNCASGHRNFFAHVARKIGLEGKLTATVAGDKLAATLREHIGLLGDFPHHKMNVNAGRKKGGTRMLKMKCRWDDCGFQFYTSAAQIERMNSHDCPACLEIDSLKHV